MEKKHTRIIDKHVSALLAELKIHGVDALGIAGGVVINGGTAANGSTCHTFYMIHGDVTADGGPADGHLCSQNLLAL